MLSMTLVEDGGNYRIFKCYTLGFIPYLLLEDSRNAVQKGGTWIGVKFKKFYFKSVEYVRTVELT